MANLSVFVCSLYLLVLTSYSMAITLSDAQKEQIRQHFMEAGLDCIKDNPISANDITSIKNKKVPSGPNVPCFFACVFKHSGLMDTNGMVQKESTLDLAKKVFDDADELKAIEDYLHSCSHVNSEPVSDGDKGCGRAMLSYKCMMENAAKFGFDLDV